MRSAGFAFAIAAAGVLAAGQVAFAQAGSNTDATQGSAGATQGTANPSQSGKHKAKKSKMDNAAEASGGTLGAADRNFVSKAAAGGMAEVKLGQLAQEKGSTDKVKNFGRQMVEDHTKANNQLKQIAQTKGVTIPEAMDPKDQAEYDRLSKLSGMEFDQAYLKFMDKDHKKDVSEFRKESKSGSDPEIKSFAASTLPTLESHLRMAEAGQVHEHNAASSSSDSSMSGSTGTMNSPTGTSRQPNTDNSGNMPGRPNPTPR